MSEKKRLMLIDGHALAYRAYHAIPPLTSPTGEPTNAAFGFVNMLLKALADYQPDYVITSFDVGRTFRHEEYEAYKAHRLETPDDLKPQIGRIYELVDALGIPICTMEGYEADDVLGSLSAKAQREGLDTIIVTGDSDVFQLVGEGVRVLVPQRTFGDVALYDVEAIKERYGLLPEQLIDLKALMGDSSDNIPGVAGVGAKTANRCCRSMVRWKRSMLTLMMSPRHAFAKRWRRGARTRGSASAWRPSSAISMCRWTWRRVGGASLTASA